MKAIIEYFRIFNKQNTADKFSFIWMLFIPSIFFFIRYNGMTDTINNVDLQSVIYFYWGFMILSAVISSFILTMINYRDSSFLKSFAFVSGNKNVVILGRVFSQLLYTLILITMFNILVSVIYHISTFQLLFEGLLTVLIAFIPICFSMMWMLIIPLSANNISSLSMVFIILLLYLANIDVPREIYLVYNLNPIVYLTNIRSLIYNISFYVVMSFLITTIIYLVIGFLSLKKLSVIPKIKK